MVQPNPPTAYGRSPLAALRWVAEQGAVRTDVLAHVLGPRRPCTPAQTRRVVDAWRIGGLVEHERRLTGHPGVVWATRTGRRHIGLSGPADQPALGLLEHLHAVSLVRVGVERRGGRDWTSERILYRERPTPEAHVADARFSSPAGVATAVEVELTPKGAARLTAILDELTLDHELILYVVDRPRVRTAVARAAARLGVEERVLIADLACFALEP